MNSIYRKKFNKTVLFQKPHKYKKRNQLFLFKVACEQYHSEIKSELDQERLPSEIYETEIYETNVLILDFGLFAYNLLLMIGQEIWNNKIPP